MVVVRGALNVGPAGKSMGVEEEERGQCAMRRSGAEERNRVAVGPEGGGAATIVAHAHEREVGSRLLCLSVSQLPTGTSEGPGSGHDSASPLCVICLQAWLVSDRTDLIYNFYEAWTEFKQTTLGKCC